MTLYLMVAREILEAEFFTSEMPLPLLLPPPLPLQKWLQMKWSEDLNCEYWQVQCCFPLLVCVAACLHWMNPAAFNDKDETGNVLLARSTGRAVQCKTSTWSVCQPTACQFPERRIYGSWQDLVRCWHLQEPSKRTVDRFTVRACPPQQEQPVEGLVPGSRWGSPRTAGSSRWSRKSLHGWVAHLWEEKKTKTKKNTQAWGGSVRAFSPSL